LGADKDNSGHLRIPWHHCAYKSMAKPLFTLAQFAAFAFSIFLSYDLAFLIKGKIELSEMVALKQKGIAPIRLAQFQNCVIDLLVKAVSKAV